MKAVADRNAVAAGWSPDVADTVPVSPERCGGAIQCCNVTFSQWEYGKPFKRRFFRRNYSA